MTGQRELQAHAEAFGPESLLVSFDAGVLIPRRILDALKYPAYNFHPAPPEYPGRDPYHFAVYEGASLFGATVHEMATQVDAGAVIAVEYFDIADGASPADLLETARGKLWLMLERLAPLFVNKAPIKPLDVSWGERKTTRADFIRMCEISPDIDAAEFARRFHAFDGGEYDNLYTTIHGYKFRIEKTKDEPRK